VFNSSPVTFQLMEPDCTQSHPPCKDGDVYPADFGSGGKSTVQFAPGLDNRIRAMFNVLGVRFYTDDNPFARSVDLLAPGAAQGVDQWICSHWNPGSGETCPDDSSQSQFASLVDVNGDGLADRVV